jgi:hypothetical protein
MKDELAWRHLVFGDGIVEQRLEESRTFSVGDALADDPAAEDVDDDIEVEAGPLCRPLQFSDVPGPDFIRPHRQQFGFSIDRIAQLLAPGTDLAAGIEDTIHRYIVRIEQWYMPSSSRVAYISAGARSTKRGERRRSRTIWRGSAGGARGGLEGRIASAAAGSGADTCDAGWVREIPSAAQVAETAPRNGICAASPSIRARCLTRSVPAEFPARRRLERAEAIIEVQKKLAD